MASLSRRAALVASLLVLVATLAVAQNTVMSVQVREAPVRSTPSFLGAIIGQVSYGDRVEVVEVANGWAHVNLPSGTGQGWMSISALSRQQLALKAGSNVASGASSSEVALAGKGFNEQVEQQYESETQLDYTWVNKMEKIVYSPQQLEAFLKQGQLTGVGGQK